LAEKTVNSSELCELATLKKTQVVMGVAGTRPIAFLGCIALCQNAVVRNRWGTARLARKAIASASLPVGGDGSDRDETPPSKRKRRPMSQETKDKIAAAKRGRTRSDETKAKIAKAMSERSLSLSHRLRISEGRRGQYHSEATRKAIANSVYSTKRRLKKERLADRAAKAAVAATADLRTKPLSPHDGEGLVVEMIELEKIVVEVTRLRDELTSWMEAYEEKHGRKPDLTETSETMPNVYGKFVRYVALRDLVRRSSLSIGKTPVTWT
jgi:hypothetical protein